MLRISEIISLGFLYHLVKVIKHNNSDVVTKNQLYTIQQNPNGARKKNTFYLGTLKQFTPKVLITLI